jgi:hypothetical protein
MKGNPMKKILVTVMLTLSFSAGQMLSAYADEPNRDDALKAYKQVLANGEAANKVLSDTVKLRTVIDKKPAKLGETEVKSAVKVWFEVLDADRQPTGKLVAPSEYKWSRNEPYRIWFESAEPVAMTLSQTYPGNKTVTISPDKDYPETETIIPAGKRFVFPVNFRTDNDDADEHLGLLLVRADATMQDIGETAAAPANGQDLPIIIIEEIDGKDNIKNQDDVLALLAGCRDRLAKMSEDDMVAAKCWRFRPRQIVKIVPVKKERITQSADSDEAATVVIGAGKITYLNIVLHKR